jgi:hypothetical protein
MISRTFRALARCWYCDHAWHVRVGRGMRRCPGCRTLNYVPGAEAFA